jgi:hypothetical protein
LPRRVEAAAQRASLRWKTIHRLAIGPCSGLLSRRNIVSAEAAVVALVALASLAHAFTAFTAVFK